MRSTSDTVAAIGLAVAGTFVASAARNNLDDRWIWTLLRAER